MKAKKNLPLFHSALSSEGYLWAQVYIQLTKDRN